MRRYSGLLVACVTIVLASGAHAAQPVFNWTGFYVGVDGGAAGLTETYNYGTTYTPYYAADSGGGFNGGVFAGLTTKLNNMFTLSGEGGVDVGDSTIWYDGGKYVVQNWDASLQARFGMPLGSGTSVYGIAGLVAASFDDDNPEGWPTSDGYSNNRYIDVGGQLGIGLQTQLTPSVFARLEAVASLYSPHTIDYHGSPYAEETPSSFAVKAGLGMQLGAPNTDTGTLLSHTSATNWSGLYAGVQGGLTGLTSYEQYVPSPYDHGYWTMTAHGGSGGVFGGYDMSIGNGLVAGVEGDLSFGNTTIWLSDDKEAVQSWVAGLHGRIGVPMGNTLVYGLAGLVDSSFDYSGYWGVEPGTNFTDFGGQVGVGVQTKLTDHLFGRVEVAGTYYAPHTFYYSGGYNWEVTPSTVTVNAGIGTTF